MKTLQECKDEVAQSRAYDNWDDMAEMEHSINMSAWEFLLKATEEAAELYASQFKARIAELEEHLSSIRHAMYARDIDEDRLCMRCGCITPSTTLKPE